jgi:hypothetical protein
MTSQRQIAANQRNAKNSTGPRTSNGKLRSRQNALRHGLTAETVIGVLERPEQYQEFENSILADYRPRSTVEHELILRLASLLWRLRRATAIESGLLQMQGQIVRERFKDRSAVTKRSVALNSKIIAADMPPTNGSEHQVCEANFCAADLCDRVSISRSTQSADIALCFLRLTNLNTGLFERLGRYETRLGRQISRTVALLEAVRRQTAKPQTSLVRGESLT